ncbi:hypothetical protein M2368_003693 [Arthrobacter sp. JUb119]|nr:hypothetical protein [Arthrobacter sp. MYb214]MCS3494661.1 hypothetical protein [Arthrobacter sp. JUb119]
MPGSLALHNISVSQDYLVDIIVANSSELQTQIIDKRPPRPQMAHC